MIIRYLHRTLFVMSFLSSLAAVENHPYTFSQFSLPIPHGENASPQAINAKGWIVGGYSSPQGIGFIFRPDGSVVSLSVPFEGAFGGTQAWGINAAGQIVGTYTHLDTLFSRSTLHGFLLDKGVYQSLDFPGASLTYALGINARGQVVGFYTDTAGGVHGYVFDRGVFQQLEVPFPG